MASTVIVALPAVDEQVYKMSSEKVPHLTLVHLGEQTDSDKLAEVVTFVQHAASQLSPFGMTVDYRGPLGANQADVLFFENREYDQRINEFRHHLLLSDTIKLMYDTADQFESWTPHITLGFPETPAHELPEDTNMHHYIQFDRIAVWMGDYDGPEFRLKYDDSMGVMAMSDNSPSLDDIVNGIVLEHSGVKGMHWGVRKGDYEGASRKTNKEAAKDAEEFARAKMFFGEGAGTRRKLIKATVEAKSKKDPTYKAAFAHHLEKQDLATHASKARSERRRKDTVSKTTKTAKGVHRQLTGGFGQVSLASAAIAGGVVMAKRMAEAQHGEAFAEAYFGHSGVKGMKWGVRKDEGHEGERIKTKKLDKLDQKWEKSIYTAQGAVAVHNAMADHFNSRIGAINDRHPDANPFEHPDSPESKAYMDDVTALETQSYAHAVTAVHGINPSGKKKAVFVEDDQGARIEVRDNNVEHSSEDTEPDLVLLLKRDAKGLILEANQAELAVSHSDAEDFLAHYGVKGMKWGVTTKDNAPKVTQTAEKKALRNAKDVTVTQRTAGKYVQTKGGQRQKAHEDAVAAQAGRQKAKKSTTDALSNKELKATIERMRLEQEYAKLDAKVKRKGENFISKLFSSPEARKAAQDLSKRVADANK